MSDFWNKIRQELKSGVKQTPDNKTKKLRVKEAGDATGLTKTTSTRERMINALKNAPGGLVNPIDVLQQTPLQDTSPETVIANAKLGILPDRTKLMRILNIDSPGELQKVEGEKVDRPYLGNGFNKVEAVNPTDATNVTPSYLPEERKRAIIESGKVVEDQTNEIARQRTPFVFRNNFEKNTVPMQVEDLARQESAKENMPSLVDAYKKFFSGDVVEAQQTGLKAINERRKEVLVGALNIPAGLYDAATFLLDPKQPVYFSPILSGIGKIVGEKTANKISDALAKSRNIVEETINKLGPDYNKYKRDRVTDYTSGLGSTVGFLVGTYLSRGLNLEPELAAGLIGALSQAGGDAHETYKKTKDIEKSYQTFLTSLPVGYSEKYGLGRFVGNIETLTKGSLKKVFAEGFKEGSEETLQEGFQSFSGAALDNLITGANRDPLREAFENIQVAAPLGFVFPFGTSAVSKVGGKLFDMAKTQYEQSKYGKQTSQQISPEEMNANEQAPEQQAAELPGFPKGEGTRGKPPVNNRSIIENLAAYPGDTLRPQTDKKPTEREKPVEPSKPIEKTADKKTEDVTDKDIQDIESSLDDLLNESQAIEKTKDTSTRIVDIVQQRLKNKQEFKLTEEKKKFKAQVEPRLNDYLSRSETKEEFGGFIDREFKGKQTELGEALVKYGYVANMPTSKNYKIPIYEYFDAFKNKGEEQTATPTEKYIAELPEITEDDKKAAKKFAAVKRHINLNLNSIEDKFKMEGSQVKKGLNDILKDNFDSTEAKMIVAKVRQALKTGIKNNAERGEQPNFMSGDELKELIQGVKAEEKEVEVANESRIKEIENILDSSIKKGITRFSNNEEKLLEELPKDRADNYRSMLQDNADKKKKIFEIELEPDLVQYADDTNLSLYGNEPEKPWTVNNKSIKVITGNQIQRVQVALDILSKADEKFKVLADKFVKNDKGDYGISKEDYQLVVSALSTEGIKSIKDISEILVKKKQEKIKALDTISKPQTEKTEKPKIKKIIDESEGRIQIVKPAPIEKPKKEPKAKNPKIEQVDQDILDLGNELLNLTGGSLSAGINPDALLVSTKLIGKYIEKGFYKFQDMLEDVLAKFGKDNFNKLFNALKTGYNAYKTSQDDDIADQMDDYDYVKKFRQEWILDDKKEETAAEEKQEEEIKITEEKENADRTEEPRTKADKETEANIEAIDAQVTLFEDEVKTSKPNKPKTKIIDKIDETINKIDEQLKLLGHYDSSGDTEKDMTENGSRTPERKFKQDLSKFSKTLASKLGWEHDTDKKGKKIYADTNVAPAGGDGTFILWKPNSEYGVYVSVPVEPNGEYDSIGDYGNEALDIRGILGKEFGDILWRITSKNDKYRGKRNQYVKGDVTIGQLADKILKELPQWETGEEYNPTDDLIKQSENVLVVKPAIKQKDVLNPVHVLNFKKLTNFAPELDKLEIGDAIRLAAYPDREDGYKYDKAIMDLHIDRIANNVYAFAHYYEQNGDLVPDPDMTVRIDFVNKTAEGLTYQDNRRYDQVYNEDGVKDEKLARSLDSFLTTWFTNIKEQGHELIEDKQEEQKKKEFEPSDLTKSRDAVIPTQKEKEEWNKKPINVLANFLFAEFRAGRNIKDNKQLTDFADYAFGGTIAQGKYSIQDAYNALETAVNMYISNDPEMFAEAKPQEALNNLRELLKRIPTQRGRTEEKDKLQQFSTPPTLAYLVNYAANPNENDTVLEPSAGNGGLVAFMNGEVKNIYTNEIDAKRREMLELQGYKTNNVDALFLHDMLDEKIKPTLIVMNPPFSATGGISKNKTSYGFQHIDQALQRLEPGGRLVAVMGEGIGFHMVKSHDWWRGIVKKYNVRANISLNGEEYYKYGTSFDNQLVVIDKTGATQGATFEENISYIITEDANTIEEAFKLLEEISNDRGQQTESAGNKQSDLSEDSRNLPGDERTGKPETGTSDGRNTSLQSNEGTGTSKGKKPTGSKTTKQPEGVRKPAGSKNDTDGSKPDGQNTGKDVSGVKQPQSKIDTGTNEEAKQRKVESSGRFVEYTPAKLKTGKKHPGMLVESASMSAVEPPDIKYTPSLDQSVIDEGKLSSAQLETVIYAGQRHSITLPGGKRAGFFIGDGTGVGKGREVAGIIADNYNQGRRKIIWVSVNNDLLDDAGRDLTDVGVKLPLSQLNSHNVNDNIQLNEGVVFSSYATMRSGSKTDRTKTRLRQILEWKPDLIIFDEGHLMKNEETKSSEIGTEIQNLLPDTRIVYSSATGATTPENMHYMQRLGLWGEKTPFTSFTDFMNRILEGGLGAMEMIARDLKAMGSYFSRSLSYEGVEYRETKHFLSDEQQAIYDKAAKLWQVVLQDINAALQATNSDKGSSQKRFAMQRFWGDHQRFFNQVITAFKVPTAISQAKKYLADNKSVVISLINTGEARTTAKALEALSEGKDLDDIDFSPREVLYNYVEAAFPVIQHRDVTNPETGKTTQVAMVDADGNPVISREAMRMRQQLLDTIQDINLPENPLDQLVNEFGYENTAELTGRKKRLIIGKDGKKKYVQRNPKDVALSKINDWETQQFQDGKKRVAIISAAASTGISLHSDKRAKNQQQRVMITLQLGWSADKQIQTFGRVHRSNQIEPPIFDLLSTDIGGEVRFSSTMAKRLDSLGAITKGQRDTSGGDSVAKYNIDSQYGQTALVYTYNQIMRSKNDKSIIVPGISNPYEILKKMGIIRKVKGGNDGIPDGVIKDIPTFLNRVLSLELDEQNAMFDYYMNNFADTIEAAKESGTFDEGVSDLKAEKIILKKEPTIVNTDEISGAKTYHYELELHEKTNPLKWDMVNKMYESTANSFKRRNSTKQHGFFMNKKSKHVYYMMEVEGKTDATTGAVSRRFKRFSVNADEKYLNVTELEAYGKLEPETSVGESIWLDEDLKKKIGAENLDKTIKDFWEEQLTKVPELRQHNKHIIGGLVMPIYDKVIIQHEDEEGRQESGYKVIRVTSDDGRRIVGLDIPQSLVGRVLNNLSIGREATSPKEIFDSVFNQGVEIPLTRGLSFKKTRLHNDDAFEIRNVPSELFDTLRKLGAFSERIDYKQRFFIPTDQNEAESVIEKLIQQFPVAKPRMEKDEIPTLAEQIQQAFDDYDNNENSTQNDIVDQVEFIAEEYSNQELTDAVEDYREAQREDYDLAGRGDMDEAFDKFEAAVKRIMNRKPLLEKDTSITDTPAFKKWFGDSKVVDADGKPLVVYHGTTQSFDTFSKWGYNYFTDSADYANMFSMPDISNLNDEGKSQIYPAYLNIKNPLDLTEFGINKYNSAEILKILEQKGFKNKTVNNRFKNYDKDFRRPIWGWFREYIDRIDVKETAFDGVILKETAFDNPIEAIAYLTLDNTQIKSATGNSGKFDPENPDIRKDKDTSLEYFLNKIKTEKKATREQLDAVVSRLENAFGHDRIKVVSDKAMRDYLGGYFKIYDKATGTVDTKYYGYNTPRGYTDGYGVYINADKATLATPIHELGHLWFDWVKQNYPGLYSQGLKIIAQEKGIINKVGELYPELKDEELLDEVLARAIGNSGADILRNENKEEARTRYERFTSWLNRLWEKIRSVFSSRGMNVEKLNLRTATLDEFANAIAGDLLSGKPIVYNARLFRAVSDLGVDHIGVEAPGEGIRKEIDVYHGSDSIFEKFNKKFIRWNNYYGFGLYFTNKENIAKKYGKNIYDITLHKGKKPGEYTYLPLLEKLSNEQAKKVYNQFVKEGTSFQTLDNYYKLDEDGTWIFDTRLTGIGLYTRISDLLGGDEAASRFLLRAGIDGMSQTGDKDITVYTVFDENAITINKVLRFEKDNIPDIDKNVKPIAEDKFDLLFDKLARVGAKLLMDNRDMDEKEFGDIANRIFSNSIKSPFILNPKQVERLFKKAKVEAGIITKAVLKPQEPVKPKEPKEKASTTEERSFPQQVLESKDVSKDIKGGLRNLNYATISNQRSVNEANLYIERHGLEAAARTAASRKSELSDRLRVTVAEVSIKLLSDEADTLKEAGRYDEANDKYDLAIEVAEAIGERGTELGQAVQAFSIFARLTPQGALYYAQKVVNNVNKKTAKQIRERIKLLKEMIKTANEETLQTIMKDLQGFIRMAAKRAGVNTAGEERERPTADDLPKGEQKKTEQKKPKSKEAEEILALKIQAAMKDKAKKYDPIREMVNTLFDIAKENELIPKKAPKTLENLLGVVSNAIRSENRYREVWDKAKEIVGKKFQEDPESLEKLSEYFDYFLKNPFSDTQITRVVKRKMDELEMDIGEIVKKHYTVSDAAKTSLAQKLVQQAGLTNEDAERLTEAIKKKFDDLATERKKRFIESRVKGPLEIGKKSLTFYERIIQDSNIGMLSTAELREAFAKRFKMKKITPDQADKIMKMADEIQLLPEKSMQQNRRIIDLLTFIKTMNGWEWKEFLESVFYANILSGVTTHAKNAMYNLFNTLIEIGPAQMYKPRDIPYMIVGLVTGYWHRGLKEAWAVLKDGYGQGEVKYSDQRFNWMDQYTFKYGKLNPANYIKFVSRAMQASDKFSHMGLREAKSYALAYHLAKDKGLKGKKLTAEMMNILNNSSEKVELAKLQAEKEGLKGLDLDRRVYEILERDRPEDIQEAALKFATRGTLTNVPRGVLGSVVRQIKRFEEVPVAGPFFKFVFMPFSNIVANVFNNNLDFTLVGYKRAFFGYQGEEGMKGDEFSEEMARATFGHMVMAALLYMTFAGGDDDDKDRWFTITATGSSDYQKNEQLRETGWRPYSFRFNGRWWNYLNTPLVVPFALIGHINDYLTYRHKEPDANYWDLISTAVLLTGNSILDMSFLSGVAKLFDVFGEDDIEKKERFALDTFVGTGSSFIVPNLVKQLATLFDDQVYVAETPGEKILKTIGIAQDIGGLKPKLNILGEPIKKDALMQKVIGGSKVKEDPVWNLIIERSAYISVPSKNTVVFDRTLQQERTLTPAEYYDYIEISGKLIKKGIGSNIEFIKLLEPDEARDIIKTITDNSRKMAREQIMGVSKITGKEELFDYEKLVNSIKSSIDRSIDKNDFTSIETNRKILEKMGQTNIVPANIKKQAGQLHRDYDRYVGYRKNVDKLNDILEESGVLKTSGQKYSYTVNDEEKKKMVLDKGRIITLLENRIERLDDSEKLTADEKKKQKQAITTALNRIRKEVKGKTE